MSRSEIARALVVVPTYNERENIDRVVERLFASGRELELLVVDDGSPDGTADAAETHAGRHPVHVMRRAGKQGLGTAYVAGFRWAIERGYDAVVEMDADLSHDPGAVPQLLAALNDADLVIGSRYVEGGRIENWGLFRRFLSRGGNLYARAWLGFGVRDSTSGFRAYRVTALKGTDLTGVSSEGYGFQIEMTRRMHKEGRRIVEVPITFVERAEGRSKMSRRIVGEALVAVARWGIRDRLARGR
ncbi:MAG TPA: polyprenol monophosphomannose synthase [Actinomycetota bacterium]|jgi:dolichol-phosphate mannosyltransferase|nr:polyprenol monophosphomannose synthase [Actinomycetota bacterium]